MRQINLLCLFFFILAGCSSYKFESKAHFMNDVDEYFNLKEERNIWVYMSYVQDQQDDYGVRLNRFYPRDLQVLKKTGLRSSAMRTLFSAVPKTSPRYHLVVLKHKNANFDYRSFAKVTTAASHYFYEDLKLDSLDIRHVLIPYGDDQRISMVYYIDTTANKRAPFSQLAYLAEINAKELQEKTPFSKSWQVFDCDRRLLDSHTIVFNKKLLKKNKVLYAKLYALYGKEEGIHFAHVLTKESPASVAVKLCPNNYRLDYFTQKGKLVFSQDIDL